MPTSFKTENHPVLLFGRHARENGTVLGLIGNSAFGRISSEQVESLSRILRDVLQKLDHTLGGPPYNLSLQDGPFLRPRAGYWNSIEEDFHWHMAILPQIARITGFESASGFFLQSRAPRSCCPMFLACCRFVTDSRLRAGRTVIVITARDADYCDYLEVGTTA
jgi:hypothetical protein